ncbi:MULTISPECIES: helix-turn-helix transcriptional regulator [Pandoraea]|uniref:Transcriptional regulator, LuxR family protein n=1 Tax=Pandoraea nosoerga TaxID=2508296 RepID=A0A5E4W3T4_9BURK|nr:MULTISPECIES: helix-turn-helix transcriptional regulator [Pandoraea]VVE17755.1 transcriptional regulator, LuxR family protein [Pandoraea nosoerga]
MSSRPLSRHSLRRARDAALAFGAGEASWNDVIRTARDFFGADAAAYVSTDKDTRTLRAFEQIGHDDKASRDYTEHYHQYDDSRRRHWEAGAGSWFESSVRERHETTNDRLFWADFMAPNHIGQITGIILANDDELAALSVQRITPATSSFTHAAAVADYGRLMRRAFLARRSATRERMDVLGQVLDPSREGYLVAAGDARVIIAAPGTQALLGGDHQLVIDRRQLTHRVPAWQARLLAKLRETAVTGQPCRMVLPDGWGRAWRLGLRRTDAGLNLGLGVSVGVRIERRDIFDLPDIAAFAELFRLSAAEARLCHYLVAGLTIDDCAEVVGVSAHTLRKQLGSALRKTGCTRQPELIRLLSGL